MWKIRTDNSEENNYGIRTKKFKPFYLSYRDKLTNQANQNVKRKVLKKPWTILEMTEIPPTSPVSPVWDYLVGKNSKNGLITWDYNVDVDWSRFKLSTRPAGQTESSVEQRQIWLYTWYRCQMSGLSATKARTMW